MHIAWPELQREHGIIGLCSEISVSYKNIDDLSFIKANFSKLTTKVLNFLGDTAKYSSKTLANHVKNSHYVNEKLYFCCLKFELEIILNLESTSKQ